MYLDLVESLKIRYDWEKGVNVYEFNWIFKHLSTALEHCGEKRKRGENTWSNELKIENLRRKILKSGKL